jgi:hypothetical protein
MPMPLVRPSRNTKRVPGVTYSGCCRNLAGGWDKQQEEEEEEEEQQQHQVVYVWVGGWVGGAVH